MNTCSSENGSSTKALLSLYMDGKNVDTEDIDASLNMIVSTSDPYIAVDELYLISMYKYLLGEASADKLSDVAERVEKQIPPLDVLNLKSVLTHCKLNLVNALRSRAVSFPSEMVSIVTISGLSELDDLATISLLAFFIGVFSDNSKYLALASKIAELILNFMKDSGEVDVLFLHEIGKYSKDKCRVSVFIMMTLYEKLTDDDRVQKYLAKLDPYTGGLFQTIDVEKRMLCRLLEKATPICCTLPKKSRCLEEPSALIKIETDGFSYVSSKEKKVGIGSISYKGDIIVPSFAPHVLPLGKSDLYGLNEPICTNGEVKDGNIKMWNRVKSIDSYGSHHVHSNVTCTEKAIALESFLWSAEKDQELSMVLFLRGSSILMEEKRYQSGGLERVLVKTSRIDVQLTDKVLQIHLNKQTSVELIPLAGQEFFWNSDFILAFPYTSGRVLSLELIMGE
ncbi:MAG: hypothetical protein SP4CHLAM5_01110 [Chlamydiia bacterium]|nr:hypothetical protein [Chlamydiia bacterium]MCH9617987.1 hypothetical protein [Chlamydiia bacterium]MCH9623688.1 hypothetical protein [Chlamydiia bacterium]